MHGNTLGDKRLCVSKAARGYTITPDKSVILKNIPAEASTEQLYDILSFFGTVIRVEIHKDLKRAGEMNKGFASFLTEADAINVKLGINHLRRNGNSLLVLPCKSNAGAKGPEKKSVSFSSPVAGFLCDQSDSLGMDWQAIGSAEIPHDEAVHLPEAYLRKTRKCLGLDSLPNLDQQKAFIRNYLVNEYKREFIPLLTLEKVVDIINYSLPLSEMLLIAVNKSLFRMYWNDALEDYEALEPKVFSLSDPAKKLRQELSIDSISEVRKRKKAIHDHLFQLYLDSYGFYPLDKILNQLVGLLRTSELVDAAVDPELFKLYATFTEAVASILGGDSCPSNQNIDRIPQLELGSHSDIASRKQGLRDRIQMLQGRNEGRMLEPQIGPITFWGKLANTVRRFLEVPR